MEEKVTMLPIRECSKRTGLSYDYLRRACLRNEIIHIRCGSKFLVNYDRLVDWLNGKSTNDTEEEKSIQA